MTAHRSPARNDFSTLALKLGINPATISSGRSDGEAFMPHTEFANRQAAADQAGWETDCLGILRIEDDTPPMLIVVCDVCGFEVAVKQSRPASSLLERAGLDRRYVGVEFAQDEVNRPTVRAVADWLADGAGLPAPAIWGYEGRGKSHLLVAACEKLMREHRRPVLFRPIRVLLEELQQYGNRVVRSQAWERAVNVDVLALDDLGVELITDWRLEHFADLVDRRWSGERPILLSTNWPPSSWDQRMDARTASRLRGMTFGVELRGRDRRERATLEAVR